MSEFVDRAGKFIEEGFYYSDFPISGNCGSNLDNFFIYAVVPREEGFSVYNLDKKEIPLSQNFARRLSRIENPRDLVSILWKRIDLIASFYRRADAPNGE